MEISLNVFETISEVSPILGVFATNREMLPKEFVFAPQTIVKPESGMAKSMSMFETKLRMPPKR